MTAVLTVLVALFAVVLTAIATGTVWWMLHAWRDPDTLRAYVEHGFAGAPDGTVVLKCEGEHEARVYEASIRHHTFARLGQLDCPVLVLAGGDASPPAGWAERAAAAIPGGRFQRVDAVGHFGPLEAPDLLADLVDAFFLDSA